jgi:hypothetical protein
MNIKLHKINFSSNTSFEFNLNRNKTCRKVKVNFYDKISFIGYFPNLSLILKLNHPFFFPKKDSGPIQICLRHLPFDNFDCSHQFAHCHDE